LADRLISLAVARWRLDQAGIQELRDDFGNYWFDETNCSEGLRRLGLYRKE
jgi:hypothetical protein